MAQRVFSFFSFWWRHNVISLNCLCFLFCFSVGRCTQQSGLWWCDDDRAPTLFRQSVGREKEKTAKWRRKSIKENSGQMKRDRPLFCFLVIRSFNSRAFSECVCVCVYAVVYGIHIRQCMCSSKLKTGKKKANDITKGGVGRDKRDTASGARQLCVCVLVVWRCPFDDAKAPRSNYFVLFSLFSFYSVFFIFQSW